MINNDSRQQRLKSLLNTAPRLQRVDDPAVKTIIAAPGLREVPVTIQALQKELLLPKWIGSNEVSVKKYLRAHGAVLFRGFQIDNVSAFESVVTSLTANAMPYTQRSSPRTEVRGNIYTSTDHPSDQYINMHNELSYSYRWPLQIMFCCLQAAAKGGETPIADSRTVLQYLAADTQELFKEKQIRYTRNLGGGLGLDWEVVFQTSDKSAVEAECRANEMTYEWKDNNRLQIRWVRPAIVLHPVTGEEIWFNHAYFFNAANLDEAVADVITSREDLPFNTSFGDGTPIPSQVLSEIGDAYDQAKIAFPWQQGDVLLMDNMLMSHGRYPYEGARNIMVAMWEPNR